MGKGIPHVDQITGKIRKHFFSFIKWKNCAIAYILLPGLDPAKPGFEKCSDEVRLNKNDAQFVEVIHTNTKAIKPLVAFGLMTPSGKENHIYYVIC